MYDEPFSSDGLPGPVFISQLASEIALGEQREKIHSLQFKYEASLENFEEEKSLLNNQISKITQQLRSLEEKYETMQQALRFRETELVDLREANELLESKVNDLEETHERQEVFELRKRVAELEVENRKLLGQLEVEIHQKESLNSAADNYIEILSENQKLSKEIHHTNALIE
jgi:chromosome segregation ATPase